MNFGLILDEFRILILQFARSEPRTNSRGVGRNISIFQYMGPKRTKDQLEGRRLAQRRRRGAENSVASSTRLGDQVLRQTALRAAESNDAIVNRLAEQRSRQSLARFEESKDETENRVAEQRSRQSIARFEESQDETENRLAWLQKERQRTLFTRKRWSRVAYSIYTLHKFGKIKTFVYKKALQVQLA